MIIGIWLAWVSFLLMIPLFAEGNMRNSFAITFPESLRHEVAVTESQVRDRDRSKPHYERKMYHALMGAVAFSLYAFVLTRSQALWTLGIIGVPFITLDLLRLRIPQMRELTLKLFGSLMRHDELNGVSANTFYLIGLIVVTALFPKPVTLLAVLFLGMGDPVAAIVGTRWGRHKIGTSGVLAKKSFEGAFANAFLSFVMTFVFALTYMALPLEKAVWLALVGGIASTFAELLPLPIDDNFTIPVVSASLLYVLAIPIL